MPKSAILDNTGKVVVNYIYDSWGNHAVVDIDGNDLTAGIGVLNPFRYRGYYYDTETGLYYLQTRYYDPELGRFISQDNIDFADPETINGLNLYAYCANNPVMNIDPTGEFFLSFLLGLAICALTFAIANTVTQLVSDTIDYATTGTWDSGWQDYVGAFFGGFIGGAIFFITHGNLPVTFGAMGAAETLATDLLTNVTGKTNYSVIEIVGKTIFSFVIGYLSGKIFRGTKINGITAGSNSFFAIWKSGLTKLFNGIAMRMSLKVILKGLAATVILRAGSAIMGGIKNSLLEWFKILFNINQE